MDSKFSQEPLPELVKVNEVLVGSSLKYSSWLLVELERLLKGVPSEVRLAALQEVEEHLDCCRLALEELGFDAAESDLEAVKRFGSPRAFANQLRLGARAGEPCYKETSLVTVATILVANIWLILGIFNMTLVWTLQAVSILTVVWVGWKHRQFNWKGVLRGGLFATMFLAVYLGAAYVELGSYGGIFPRWQTTAAVEQAQHLVAQTEAAFNRCDRILKVYEKGRPAVSASPYDSDGKFTAVEVPYTAYDTSSPIYRLVAVDIFEKAAESWRSYKNVYRGSWERNEMDALQLPPTVGENDGQLFSFQMAIQGANVGLVFTFISLCLNFLLFILHLIWDRIRLFQRQSANSPDGLA